jgi:chemotaxis protein methyltransferase CheR
MNQTWQEAEYQQLVELISLRLGLQFNDHRHRSLQGALDRLPVPNDLAQLRNQLENAREDGAMWQYFVQALTIGETYFYRNLAHVNALRDHVLPGMIDARRKSGHKILRFWSAGCATGEEPYTLAMMLRDLIPDLDTWSITLLATDVNADYLQRAREGFYRAHSFRGETPDWLQKRWFTAKDNGFLLHPSIRKMVTFTPLNLITDEYPSAISGTMSIDLILCRNVTIYFDRSQTQRVVNQFYDCLVDGGWLVVGHSEPQPGVYQQYVTHNMENAILYQKAVQASVQKPVWHEPVPRHDPVAMQKLETPRKAVPARAEPKPTAPSKIDILAQARSAANNENWATAYQLLKEAETDDILQPQIHYLRALMQMQQGDYASSMNSLRQAIYCDSSFALAHYMLGELHEKAGAMNEARRHWRRAQQSLIGLDPQQPLIFADDLTAEMLNGLLDYQLNKR